MEIREAATAEDLRTIQELFTEYWNLNQFDPSFQNFSEELASLPGPYASPQGRLCIAWLDDQATGCAALRSYGEVRCEAKRLYVRPPFQGKGIGKSLLTWLISEARRAGYVEMVCDTMPFMTQAMRMYESMGFQRIPPYSDHPTPGAHYLQLSL
jgi:putative acetyltransferase